MNTLPNELDYRIVLMLCEGYRKLRSHILRDVPPITHPVNCQSVLIGRSRWNMSYDIDNQKIILSEEIEWQSEDIRYEVQYVIPAQDCEKWRFANGKEEANRKQDHSTANR